MLVYHSVPQNRWSIVMENPRYTATHDEPQAVTFGLIPLAARVFFMSMAGVVFQVGLQTAPWNWVK